MHNIGSYDEASKGFEWSKAWNELGISEDEPFNIGHLCSDRICEQAKGEKTALIWQGHTGNVEKFSFNDLRLYSNGFANLLKQQGIKNEERVFIFMDKVPELYFSFLGILKNGSIVAPLFSAFGEESLLTRLENGDARAIITTEKLVRKIRKVKDKIKNLKCVIVATDNENFSPKEKEIPFSVRKSEKIEQFHWFKAGKETPSVLHYTSGTTGQPKGALHVHSSIIQQSLSTKWVLDIKEDDIYWCTADPGWVTGTSYGIIGPWSLGATQVVLDAGFSAEKWYQVIQNHKVSVWYSAPTAIRLLMKEGDEIIKKHDLSSLRHLCSVGEPLNAEAVVWSKEVYGLPFHDTYWQTETGSMMITNYPGMEVRPGSMGKAFPGIEAAVLDSKYEPIKEPGAAGLIAFKPGWPSMFRTYWENKETYDSKFKNGWYLAGDRSSIDKDGYFWFAGRDDDVINTGGHLVSPFEVESALLEHEAVAESAAIGKPDKINMEVVKVFIALKPEFERSDDTELSIMNFIRKRLSPLAMPQEIEFVDKLPKTRSGKIMRRLLRAQERGEPIGDTSTLEDD